MKFIPGLIILLPLLVTQSVAPPQLELRTLAFGMPAATSLTRDAQGHLIVATKDGRLLGLQADGTFTSLLDMRYATNSILDRGLLAARVKPGTNQVYLSYANETAIPDSDGPVALTVARYDLDTHEFITLTSAAVATASMHTNGDIVFMNGHSYASFGDGQMYDEYPAALDLVNSDLLNGKVVDLDTGEVYARGFRNPFRMTVHNGVIWVADVGNFRVEEVDALTPGSHYGWPCLEGNWTMLGCTGTFVPPTLYYDHGIGQSATAITFYSGTMLIGDYAAHWIKNERFDTLATLTGGPVDLQVFDDCLYSLTIEPNWTSNIASTCGTGVNVADTDPRVITITQTAGVTETLVSIDVTDMDGDDVTLASTIVVELIHDAHVHGLGSYTGVRNVTVSRVTNHYGAGQRVCVISGLTTQCADVQFLPVP